MDNTLEFYARIHIGMTDAEIKSKLGSPTIFTIYKHANVKIKAGIKIYLCNIVNSDPELSSPRGYYVVVKYGNIKSPLLSNVAYSIAVVDLDDLDFVFDIKE